MAYQTYTTEALVCGLQSFREHDATVRLFTRDAGMIYARVSGVRANTSKLRYGLQEFSLVRVTLVRGRQDWRITGAVALQNFYFGAPARNSRASVLFAMRSVRRLIHGEEVHAELFDVVADGIATLAQSADERSEKLFLLRLLHHLGYVSPQQEYAHLLHVPTLHEAYVESGREPLPPSLYHAVENALKVSHL